MLDKYLCRYFNKESITVADVCIEAVSLLLVLALLIGGSYALFVTVCSVTWEEWSAIFKIFIVSLLCGVAVVLAPELIERVGKLEVAHCKRNK